MPSSKSDAGVTAYLVFTPSTANILIYITTILASEFLIKNHLHTLPAGFKLQILLPGSPEYYPHILPHMAFLIAHTEQQAQGLPDSVRVPCHWSRFPASIAVFEAAPCLELTL